MKKYVLVAIGILIIILAIIYMLSSRKEPSGNPAAAYPTPTVIQAVTKTKPSHKNSLKAGDQLKSLRNRLPVETDEFIIEYSPNLNKIVVTRKTPEADFIFPIWARENGFDNLVDNKDTTIISDKTMEQVQTPLPTQSPQESLDNALNFFSIMLGQ